GAVGDGGNINDDRLVHFVDGILDRGQSDRAVGAAGRDRNPSAGGSVVACHGGGAGEGQVDRDGLGRQRAQSGGHGGDAPGLSHGAAAQTQGDSRRSVVINNRARAGGGGEGRIGWVGEIDVSVVLVQLVVDLRDAGVLSGQTGREGECAGGQCVVHATPGGGAPGD